MNVYIFAAALYCEECGSAICERLLNDGIFTTGKLAGCDPADEYTYDSDDFPKGPIGNGGGEADCVQTCDSCHCLLENPLTSHGWNNLVDSLIDDLGKDHTLVNREYWDEVLDYYSEVFDCLKERVEERLRKS